MKYSILIFMIVVINITLLSQNKSNSKNNQSKKNESNSKQKSIDTDSTTASDQQKIKWMTFAEAIEKNKHYPKKKIFIDFYTDWCGWCKRMDAVTYSHPVIINYVNEVFWPVKFNAETKDTITIDGKAFVNPNPKASRSAHQLAVNLLNNRMSYPTLLFMNESNNTITIVPGFYNPKDFEAIIKYIGDNEYLKQPFDQFKSEFVGVIKE